MKTSSIGDANNVKQDLVGRSVRGSASLFLSEIGCNCFRLLGTVVMARLLMPEHFGLISMVTALTAFGEMFKDLGLGTATIQQKEITHKQISTLFWINVGVGAGFMLVLAGLAPVISWFYNEPRLFWICMAISSTFFFGGLTVQHQALLRRQMRFPQLALIQVFSTALSTLIGILLAWQGLEYWALVWKEVSRAMIQTGGTWVLSHWLPGLPVKESGVRKMFQTGSHVTGFNILAFASQNLDQVLLGKFWGAEPLGLYKQAAQLLRLPVSLFSYPITNVMTPALSAVQSEAERYRSYYGQVVSFMAFCYMPMVAYFAIYSDSIIALLLGDKWLAAVPILQVLALGAIIEPIAATSGIVMITCGKTRDYLRLGIVRSVAQSLAIAIGVKWGLLGVAVACSTYTLLSLPFLLWFSFKTTPITPGLVYGALWFPALASSIMSVILIVVKHLVHVPSAFIEIGYSAVLAPFLYVGVSLLFPGGKESLREHFSRLNSALGEVTARIWSPVAQPDS